MIRKVIFGTPFDTEAVTGDFQEWTGEIPWLTVEEGRRFSCRLGAEDIVYGLGENVRGINKRGWLYESCCSDDPRHTEDKNSLYGAHNFLIVDGEQHFGVFVDYPGRVTFDVGYTDRNLLTIEAPESNLALYLIDGEAGTGEKNTGSISESIVRQFRHLIGRSYIPPRWAFGYGQSRWSYMNEDEVREVVREHRKAGIPLDAVYLDIDYMERYKDFTVNEESFPDLAGFSTEMRKQGIHLVPIIDAGVKIEEGYDVYEEGLRNGWFCKEEDGREFVAGVWPGRVHFPDMLNADARRWFGRKYKVLLDQGIDGFWNDMNEPAIFYSEENLQEVFKKLEDYRAENLDIQSFFAFQGEVSGLSNNREDYKRFYHEHKDGRVRHDRVHNLFGYNMTRAAGEAFAELCPGRRILMFSRSSYIGMHRYGGIWTGDNLSWWSHILLNLRMMPSLNMCGILYTGADLGGFGADATEDLLLRWLALGIFTPLMRNHAAMGTRKQEAWRFTQTESFRNIISLRYILLPYLYSEFMKAALRDEMYFRPLAFVWPEDSFARGVEDQLMVGESIMIAPVYEQNAKGRYVYLPERMKQVRYRSPKEREETILEPGHHYLEIGLEEVVFFIRPEHLVPVSGGGCCVEQVDFANLGLLGFVEKEASYELYDDDGCSMDYENPAHYTGITLSADGKMSVKGTGHTFTVL